MGIDQPFLNATSGAAGGWSLDVLHPDRVAGRDAVRSVLERVRRESICLRRGMNRRIDPERAWIERLEDKWFVLRTENFEQGLRSRWFLNFSIGDQPHFFSAPVLDLAAGCRATLEIPRLLYIAERRDHSRRIPMREDPHAVALRVGGAPIFTAAVADVSSGGLGVIVPSGAERSLADRVEVALVGGHHAGGQLHGKVRRRTPMARVGWTHIGMSVTNTLAGAPVPVEILSGALPLSLRQKAQRGWKGVAAGIHLSVDRFRERVLRAPAPLPEVHTLAYRNSDGEELRAIIDSWGDTRGATAVVIPPAWGRTKESLMPLAACVVSAFRAAGEPVIVVRFDGIRKRGESHNDPECSFAGRDHHRFTFSQGVRDIYATLDFLEGNRNFGPRSNILVSFSAAAIESRRAVASDTRIDGWVSVVGASDLQSMLRVISGGVDYALGMEKGLRFGFQEILGIEVDMDYAGLDAFEHNLVYLEDARRDMERILVPVTWIHGTHDAWMDKARAREVLSRGDTARRRFIEVPTGHMLKTSREALETFQLVVSEIARMALGHRIEPVLPDLVRLDRTRRSERLRLPRRETDLRRFWRDYLLGRDRSLGIELMTSIAPYRDMMRRQVAGLSLGGGEVVADLGSGTGALATHLVDIEVVCPAHIVEVDFVSEGLRRARLRLAERRLPDDLAVSYIAADLDEHRSGAAVPLSDGSVDAVLAALLVSYVGDPLALLREIRRVLRPGGRVVISSLRRDADMSRLYIDGVTELRSGGALDQLGRASDDRIDTLARGYLNEASRLLDLEESGTFRFFDPDELGALVAKAGFVGVRTELALGSPPQAVVLADSMPRFHVAE